MVVETIKKGRCVALSRQGKEIYIIAKGWCI